jgi:hypothetical protein
MFFDAQNRMFSDHESPRNHHKFTSQKPRSGPRFSQTPFENARKLQNFAPSPRQKKNPEKNGVG